MAYTWCYEAGSQVRTQLGSLGTQAQVITVVPREYGHHKPNSASTYWINIELLGDRSQAETQNSYLVYMKLGIWVWIGNVGTLDTVSQVLSNRAFDVRSELMYSNLGGWARLGIANDAMSDGKFIKGGSDNTKYGYYFEITVEKQITVT